MASCGVLFTSVWLYRAVRVTLGLLFAAAGVIKLSDPMQFAVVIDAFGLVPHGAVMPVAYVLPVLEVAAGIGLVCNVRGSLSTIAVLTLLFLAVLGYGLHLGLDIDCGCYGPGDPEAGAFSGLRDALYRDVWMFAGVVYCFWWRRSALKGRCAAPSEPFATAKEKTHA